MYGVNAMAQSLSPFSDVVGAPTDPRPRANMSHGQSAGVLLNLRITQNASVIPIFHPETSSL